MPADTLVLVTMKNTAKCDRQFELQHSVKHRIFERTLRSQVDLRAYFSEHRPKSISIPIYFGDWIMRVNRDICFFSPFKVRISDCTLIYFQVLFLTIACG
jgi:hypothetical protein